MTPIPPAPFMVGIAGGSGSGKTTLARAVAATLGSERVAVLSHDAYYRDRSALPPSERDRVDYDAPDALDQARFRTDLGRLRRGESVCPPRYSFATHCRVGDDALVEARPIVLVEGLLLLHDPLVRAALDLTLFVDAPVTVRLARRLERDTTERGRPRAAVLRQFAESVTPAHVRYVEPTRALADVILQNRSRLEPLVEIAAALIRTRLERREEEWSGARAQLA